MKKYFLIFFILLTIFRLGLIPIPSFKTDMDIWQAWASRLIEVGPNNFYHETYFSDYLPGYLYMLLLKAYTFHFIFPSVDLFSSQFGNFLKFINTLFDIATCFYIFKIVNRYNQKWSYTASLLYLANPALIFTTSIWGQVDGILSFFMVASLYYLLELKKLFTWSFIASLAFLVKPQSASIMPIVFLKFCNPPKIGFLKYLFLIPVFLFLLALPFFLNDPLGIFNLLQKAANQYPYTSVNAFNLWSLVGLWIPDEGGYKIIGLVLYTLALVLIGYPLLRLKSLSNHIIYYASALSVFSFFLFPTRIHERYILPFFALFIIVACINKSAKLVILYLLISIITLLNLWYVYFYYNFIHDGIINPPTFFILLQNHYSVLSVITLLTFAFLTLNYYHLLEHEKIKDIST